MKHSYKAISLAVWSVTLAMGIATTAALAATPVVNGAVIKTRIFNDCPNSTLATVNSYPALISISDDADPPCVGFANLHNWRFSSDGGTSPTLFMNKDTFFFGADLVISGPGEGESGLQVSPWFSADVDGRFNVRTTDGEIAVFGGALPFYSFSGAPHNLRYTKGTLIHLEMNYHPNAIVDTATIEYKINYNGQSYTSGPLKFNNCNESERPIYGCYGILNFAQAGGHLQALWQAGGGQLIQSSWTNIVYGESKDPVSTVRTTWSKLKMLYR